MSKEDFEKQIRTVFDHRVAVRVYNGQEISHGDMDFILDTARLSPSSIGLEAWRLVVLDRKQIEKLRDGLKAVAWGAQYRLDTASHSVLLIAEKNARYDSESVKNSLIRRGLDKGDALNSRLAAYESLQKNDMKMADNPRVLFDWTAKQTCIALRNMMITASVLGIDSCPIEGFNYEKVNSILTSTDIINPDNEGIVNMVSFGYRLRDPKHLRSCKPREEVVTWLD